MYLISMCVHYLNSRFERAGFPRGSTNSLVLFDRNTLSTNSIGRRLQTTIIELNLGSMIKSPLCAMQLASKTL